MSALLIPGVKKTPCLFFFPFVSEFFKAHNISDILLLASSISSSTTQQTFLSMTTKMGLPASSLDKGLVFDGGREYTG